MLVRWFGLIICGIGAAGHADEARWCAEPPVERNVRFVRMAPVDGDARSDRRDGRACLRTDAASGNRYIYFDVARSWLKSSGHEPYTIEVTLECFDAGVSPLAIQYDAMGGGVEANFREVGWQRTDTRRWRTFTARLDAAEFRNGQHGKADFRIAAQEALCLAAVTLRVLAASALPPPVRPIPQPRFPDRRERIIALDGATLRFASPPDELERIAFDRFRTRLEAVGMRRRKDPYRRGRLRYEAASSGATIVLGRWRPELARRYPRTAAAMRKLAADPVAYRRRDGYALVVERLQPALICAVGLHSEGAAYAIGDLHVRSLRERNSATLRLPREPRIEAPALDRRELYLNIGYGLRRDHITVEDWSQADWQRYIDRLVLARYNTWSFYLWGDCAMLHPAAQANRALNLRVHRALRDAIRYAHRRGMKVGLHFTPTMVPVEIWTANPTIRATLEYTYPGTVCPSQEAAWRWMREVQEREIGWFAECDFFSLWYYDVGGCFCETCRNGDQQLRVLLRQAETFAPIVRRRGGKLSDRRAVFQVMAWAIWRYERMHGFTIRDRFATSLRKWFAERRIPLMMADGIYVDPGTQPLFDLMRRERIPAKAFLYQTNIETGQPFPIVHTRYLARWVPACVSAGATSAFLMRIEAGTKQSDDFIAGAYLWNPRVAREEAVDDCARLFTADVKAERNAREALIRMDDFAWFGKTGGGADAVQGRLIARLTAQAAASCPKLMRESLEWLVGAGQAYAILGEAVDAYHEEDAGALEALNVRFEKAMRASPLYRAQVGDAPYWRDLFRSSLVRYFYSGWTSSHF
jgi:hypothetical protein